MKDPNFYSNHLIEILREQYQAGETIFTIYNKIINNENLAFKMIQFISQIEIILTKEELGYRKKIIQGSCIFALDRLSENPTKNLFEAFLKKYPMNTNEDLE